MASNEYSKIPSPDQRVRVGPPRYFYLLWDEDLDEMRELFRAIRDHRAEVVANWYQLYVVHSGDVRALSEEDAAPVRTEVGLLLMTHSLGITAEQEPKWYHFLPRSTPSKKRGWNCGRPSAVFGAEQ